MFVFVFLLLVFQFVLAHLAVVGVLDCFVVVDQIGVVAIGELLHPVGDVHLVVQTVLVVHAVRLGQAGGCNKIFYTKYLILKKWE